MTGNIIDATSEVGQAVEQTETNTSHPEIKESKELGNSMPVVQQNNLNRINYHGSETIGHENDSTSQLRREADHSPQNSASFERLLTDVVAQILQKNRSNQDNSANLFRVTKRRRTPDISFKRQQLIDKIWSDVKPFHMDHVEVLSTDQTFTTAPHSRCVNSENLKALFLPDGSDILPLDANSHLTLLKSKVEQVEELHARDPVPWAGFRVMAACAELAQENGVQLGRVLLHCYQHGILEQPQESTPEYYLEHVLLVVHVSLLMNETLHFDIPRRDSEGEWLGEIEWCVEVLTRRKSLEEIFGIKLHCLLEVYHIMYHAPSTLVRAPGATFVVDDLNIKALGSVGRLSIVWTTTFEDHLLLDLDKRVLFVSWFHKPFSWLGVPMDYWQRMMNNSHLPQDFVEFPAHQNSEARKFPSDEILLSWAILFATSPIARVRNNDIAALGQPSAIQHSKPGDGSTDFTSEKTTSPSMFSLNLTLFSQRKARHNIYNAASPLSPHQGAVDMDSKSGTPYIHTGYRAMTDAALDEERIAYSKFPIYESRLRELRQYMDDQKVKEASGLRTHSKGSLSDRAYWVLVLLGLVVIILGFCGLAVGIVQTVVGFRILGVVNSQGVGGTA